MVSWNYLGDELTFIVAWKKFKFLRIFWNVTYGIRAHVQTLGLKRLNSHKQTVNKIHAYWFIIFEMLLYKKKFWTRIVGMEGLEEYVEEGSPLNEQSNSRKEPINEEITNNSYELLQTVK